MNLEEIFHNKFNNNNKLRKEWKYNGSHWLITIGADLSIWMWQCGNDAMLIKSKIINELIIHGRIGCYTLYLEWTWVAQNLNLD